jgi:hypothetical protein
MWETTSWNALGHSRPVRGLLYFLPLQDHSWAVSTGCAMWSQKLITMQDRIKTFLGSIKVTLEQVTKAQKGNRSIATRSLTSAIVGVGGQRHTPAALSPGKTRYPLHRRLGRPHGRSGQVQKISPPTRIRSPDRPARSESLYRLRYPDPHFWTQWIHQLWAVNRTRQIDKRKDLRTKYIWQKKIWNTTSFSQCSHVGYDILKSALFSAGQSLFSICLWFALILFYLHWVHPVRVRCSGFLFA